MRDFIGFIKESQRFITITISLMMSFFFSSCSQSEVEEQQSSSNLGFIDSGETDQDQPQNLAELISGEFQGQLHIINKEMRATAVKVEPIGTNIVRVSNPDSESNKTFELKLYKNKHAILAENASEVGVRFIYNTQTQNLHFYNQSTFESFVMQ